MTIQEQIAALNAQIEAIATSFGVSAARSTINRLRAYGASWALDCREMRIAEATLDNAYAEMYKLRMEIQDLNDADLQLGEMFEAFIGAEDEAA